MKKILSLALICAFIGSIFFVYKEYKRYQVTSFYSEIVKNTSYKTLAVVEGEVSGSAMEESEMLSRLDAAIAGIEKSKNLARLLSKNTANEVSVASMEYIDNCEQLVHVIEAKFRVGVGLSKATAATQEAFSDTRDHGKLESRELRRNTLLLLDSLHWVGEAKKYSADLLIIIRKLNQSRNRAAIFLPTDALIPIEKIEELTRISSEENKSFRKN